MVALSTKDNPYNPFTQFYEWFLYDISNGYYSCDYLSRVAKTSSELTDYEYGEEVEQAIDDIVKYDPLNIYIKVKADDPPPIDPKEIGLKDY